MHAALRALAVCAMSAGGASAQPLDYSDLHGWAAADHAAALSVFRTTCDLTPWPWLCNEAARATDARSFFETHFTPALADGPALFTAYYEPELEGALTPDARFAHPVYALPPEGPPAIPRAEMHDALRGRGLELLWLADPAEAFFLQVQGSGRVRLPDGRTVRLGYAGKNGLEYRSIGREMVRRGTMTVEQATAEALKDWIRANPEAGRALMNHNTSFVFFRTLDLPPQTGPLGAMDRPVTAMGTAAVDPAHVPLGLPVWVEKDGDAPLRRLFIAQDTGSAIKGPARADLFYGSGPAAGFAASDVADGGRMVVLMPVAR